MPVAIRKQKNTTKAELVKYVAKELELSFRVSAKSVETFLNTVRDALLDGNEVDFSPFGAFIIKKQGSRISRNPHTGEKIPVKGKSVPAFVPGRELTF